MTGATKLCAALLGLVLWCWPLLGHCQSLADADAFVHSLYQRYLRGPNPDYLGADGARVFSPRLLALIRRDARVTPAGDVPSLDGDPICDCQDPGGLHGLQVRVAGAGPGRAVAKVSFRFFKFDTEMRALTFDLVAVRGRWLVDDIHSKDTPSLVRLLLAAHPYRHRPRAG
jgi:hypothetical protein